MILKKYIIIASLRSVYCKELVDVTIDITLNIEHTWMSNFLEILVATSTLI